MIKIGFIVTPEFPIMSLAALSVFEFANLSAEKRLYDVDVLSEAGGPVSTTMGATVQTSAFSGRRFDTLIIGGNTRVVPTSPKLKIYVARAARRFRRIASICTGAFALADAGVLDGRRITTHWLFTEELKTKVPKSRLEAGRLFVVDGPVWTAAGNSAGIDLALSMLEGDYGADLARDVARIMVVDQRRSGGQSQRSALLEMSPKADRIQSALIYARANLKTSLPVETLARAAGLGPRQFSRAFRAQVGMPPAKAVEALRLDAARLMLEQGRHPIEVIATEVGFGDQERMRRAFVRQFGHSPQAARRMARHDN
jgi:transcriptional regulator GlxA family with amidase domain